MNFEFFAELSTDEAREYLDRFLHLESQSIGGLFAECSKDGVVSDYSLRSVAPLLRWVATKLTVIPTSPDERLPEWIRNTDSYANNLFEFEEPSKLLLLRAAFYLGESFVRSFRTLRWTIGNTEYAQAKMPVVSGFQKGLEMAPILIIENLFGRVVADPTKVGDIDRAIEYWSQRT